jgi:hypothetical protein
MAKNISKIPKSTTTTTTTPIYNVIHYVCGAYPFDFGGVARFDSLLQEAFPKRIFIKAQEESQKLYQYCLENPLTTLVITDNQHACDVPQNIPCIVFHHGVARTHAERDSNWNKTVRDICVNGQDEMFKHRLPYNTIFISISKFCSDEFQRHYGKEYDNFQKFLLHVPIEKRISAEWSLKKTKANKYKFQDPFNMSTLKEGDKPKILGDWSTVNKGSEIIPKLKELLSTEFEFVQLKTPHTQNIEQHRKNIENFYKSCQMYFQISTSEGSSFASEDGLAYGLLTIASNVGQFYETPNHVASTFDWQKRNDIAFLADKIRTTWKNRENYNPVEWMREHLDWDKWVSTLQNIIDTFKKSVNMRIISYPVVQRNSQVFWQYPVITEKYCLDKISQQSTLQSIQQNFIYVGIPYATIIDKNITPLEELASIGKQVQILKKLLPKGTPVYTSCQHIHYHKILDLVKMLGITDIFISHKQKDQAPILNGIRIHGLPLYPVNIFNKERTLGTPDPLPTDRKYLFSFIGAHMNHYMNPIRKSILSWNSNSDSPPNNWYIQDTKIWHFEKTVYNSQVHGAQLSPKDYAQLDEQTAEYNSVLANSTFSLCPIGAGPNTIRLWESACLKAIPVIIADEFDINETIPKDNMPLEPFYLELPYKSPYLKSPETLEAYLQTIPHEKIEIMRKGCEQVKSYLEGTFLSPMPA